MNFYKLIKRLIIDSQIFVSLMGTSLAVFFFLQQGVFRLPATLLIFITYLCGYLYTKYQSSKYFLAVLLLCGFSALVCIAFIIYNHNLPTLLKWVFIVILGLFYNSSFLAIYIRRIPLLKIFYVGLVWALVNSWLVFEALNIPVFFISFFFVSALVLPFDIRDMNDDEVLTFPKIIGVRNTKILALLMLLAAQILGFFYLPNPYATAFSGAVGVSLFFVLFSKTSNPESYFSIGVESCCGLPFILLLFL
ncbi:hypothetical protein [Bergeyella cardium]|uniref:Uncharacterized protein n=1 Tax=Bergeyella cardium TaxID=1585976 RepID=A0A6P1QV62_9FLAO|nr:hypothetical protein [Bergeyella cardium]QHN65699.1 hypothetical protein DBX24_07285 [Bergeyella cardium]WHE33288.1 hypothetical protein P8603_07330 [Bergeyella cardium]WHF59937.1 hypothetical protein O0R51_07325 [Bergeyella cardium]